jgi:hypothetical protein
MNELTKNETEQLAKCEAKIMAFVYYAVRVGRAMQAVIQQLPREFEEQNLEYHCRLLWNLEVHQVYRLIHLSQMVDKNGLDSLCPGNIPEGVMDAMIDLCAGQEHCS